MRAGVIVFPGSNCDRDLARAFEAVGAQVEMIWHKETSLPQGLDIVGLPGGFSYGDYLRCGAIAAQSPICKDVIKFAQKGGYVLGICNGFQVLCETQLLPGVLVRNAGLKFVCRAQGLKVEDTDSAFTNGYKPGQEITIPIAHHDGNYSADSELLRRIEDQQQVAFRYVDNPNGSQADIAGVFSENRRVLGMMPHPERVIEDAQGGSDGLALFRSIVGVMEAA